MPRGRATVKRVTLELGGKSPNIIFADADLRRPYAALRTDLLWKGRGLRGGIAAPRGAGVHDQIVEQLADGPRSHPRRSLDKNTRLARSYRSGSRRRAVLYRSGREGGAQLVAGGKPAKVNGKGYYVEATVFDGAKPGMKIVDEEISARCSRC